jgi:hypothetical protein
MNLGQLGPYSDILPWLKIRPSTVGTNNTKDMANIYVNKLLAIP